MCIPWATLRTYNTLIWWNRDVISRHRVDDTLMYPTLFWLHFSIANNIFHDVAEVVLPAEVGNTILNIDTKHVNRSKIYLFRTRSGQDKTNLCNAILAYRYGVRSVHLVSPSCPPEMDFNKNSQISILLLNVHSLSDIRKHINVMKSWCSRHWVDYILMYQA